MVYWVLFWFLPCLIFNTVITLWGYEVFVGDIESIYKRVLVASWCIIWAAIYGPLFYIGFAVFCWQRKRLGIYK